MCYLYLMKNTVDFEERKKVNDISFSFEIKKTFYKKKKKI